MLHKMISWKEKWPRWVTKTGGVNPFTPNSIKQDIYDYKLSIQNPGIVRVGVYQGKDVKIDHLCVCQNPWLSTPANALRGKRCPACSKASFSKNRPRKIKPANYWTYDRCAIAASSCSTKSQFRREHRSAYNSAKRNDWMNELTKHMNTFTGKYTKEVCKEAALSCLSREEFRSRFRSEYLASKRNDWLNDITSHMKPSSSDYWTYKRCISVALLCQSKTEFTKKYPSAYWYAKKNGWYEDITRHMIQGNVIWTEEKCKKIALKYKTRKAFKNEQSSAYGAALRYGIIDDICSHMSIEHNGYHHCVYAIVNESLNTAYIGVTVQEFYERMKQHKRASNTTNSKMLTNLDDTQYIQLTDYQFTSDEVRDFAEQKYIQHYKNNGYKVVNDVKTIGRVGTTNANKWTYERCKEAALNCTTRTQYYRKYPGAAAAATKHGWIEELISHLGQKILTSDERYEQIKLHAQKCGSLKEFRNLYITDYNYASRYGWLDELTFHMSRAKKQNGYYTKSVCKELAKQYYSLSEFQDNEPTAYQVSKSQGWFESITSHMTKVKLTKWLHPNANVELWADANNIFALWENNGRCGFKKLGKLYSKKNSYALESIVDSFKVGWIPSLDPEWIKWVSDK